MSLRGDKICIVTLLFAASTVYAKPTVTDPHMPWARHAVAQELNGCRDTAAEQSNFVARAKGKLAAIATEMFEPPPVSGSFTYSGPVETPKSLPAVPGAVFMVLTGFACVSLVRDRRLWLAALAGLLWAGQAGIQAVPQFARHLTYGNRGQQHCSWRVTRRFSIKNTSRLRSDIEGTRYAGLLRHLEAIPVRTSPRSLCAGAAHPIKPQLRSRHWLRTVQSPVCAWGAGLTVSFYCCSTISQEQFVHISSAILFENLARGPPACQRHIS